jgi:predicted nucleotidyltransferase
VATRARIELDPGEIEAFCQRHQIAKLSLFGSVLRDDFDDESDVDVLIELEPGASVNLWTLAGVRGGLVDLLGRDVDVTTPALLSPYIRKRVLDSAEAVYVRRR